MSQRLHLSLMEKIVPLVTRYSDLFERMIVDDWYDGPVAGAGQSAKDCAVYEFQLLDQSENTELRIMRLTQLSDDAFDRLVSICSQVETPYWPTWVLGGENRDPDAWQKINSEFIRFRELVSIPDYVIAWRNSDSIILSIKTMDSSLWSDIEYKAYEWEWFNFLGLESRKCNESRSKPSC